MLQKNKNNNKKVIYVYNSCKREKIKSHLLEVNISSSSSSTKLKVVKDIYTKLF